jgi:hypothetical protein
MSISCFTAVRMNDDRASQRFSPTAFQMPTTSFRRFVGVAFAVGLPM